MSVMKCSVLGTKMKSIKGPKLLPHTLIYLWTCDRLKAEEEGLGVFCSLNSLLWRLHRFRDFQKPLPPIPKEGETWAFLFIIRFYGSCNLEVEKTTQSFSQPGFWNRLNPIQTEFCLFHLWSITSCQIGTVGVENDRLNHDLLWGWGINRIGGLWMFLSSQCSPPSPSSYKCRSCHRMPGKCPALKPGHQVARFSLCFKF